MKNRRGILWTPENSKPYMVKNAGAIHDSPEKEIIVYM